MPQVEVCVPSLVFWYQIFYGKCGKFLVPSIQPLPVPSYYRPFKTGYFPSRLSPENETETPEFEILYLNSQNSQNSVLLRNFLIGY